MATYSLLFGHAEWPDQTARSRRVRSTPEADPAPVERLTVALPVTLKSRLDATAALEGVPAEAWIVRALARSVDPRLVAP
jgi:hypothetical protein